MIDSKCEEALTSTVDFAIMLAKEVKSKGEPNVKRGSIQKFLLNSSTDIRSKTGRDSVAVIDFRNLKASMVGTNSIDSHFWQAFVECLENFKDPKWNETNVWVWITNGDWKEQVHSLYDQKLKTSHNKSHENYYHLDPLEDFKSDKHTKGKMVTIFTIL